MILLFALPNVRLTFTIAHHNKAVLAFWEQLRANNHLHKGMHTGFYSSNEETFVPNNEVLYDYTKKRYIHVNTGQEVETYREQNYLFPLGKFKEGL